MSEARTYTGGCHCGKVRYEVKTDLKQVVACNCSICSKRGWLLTFVPADQITFQGEVDGLTDYQFGKKHIHHLFCPVCGVGSFSRGATPDGRAMIAVNVRCLEVVDPSMLTLTSYDGRSR